MSWLTIVSCDEEGLPLSCRGLLWTTLMINSVDDSGGICRPILGWRTTHVILLFYKRCDWDVSEFIQGSTIHQYCGFLDKHQKSQLLQKCSTKAGLTGMTHIFPLRMLLAHVYRATRQRGLLLVGTAARVSCLLNTSGMPANEESSHRQYKHNQHDYRPRLLISNTISSIHQCHSQSRAVNAWIHI